ncbi:MAG: polysaccharide biosynthesis protein [Phycisphaerales bacterium]|nr:polysaccharide biosynthesis protein [Phycisphaerales bacterium]
MLADIFRQLRRTKRSSAAAEPAPSSPACASVLEQNDLQTLLKRPAVNLDTPELQRFLADKRVLVTGAGGSIGSEICRQIMKFCPASLVLVEQAENALFEIDQELRQRWMGMNLVPCVADIGDAQRLDDIFTAQQPQVIFHCAAHKHVPMMEANPGEAIKNNILGTQILADAALAHGCAAFVMVSTDKAVNPTSVMGATKRVAEMYVQSLNHNQAGAPWAGPNSSTRFVAVRFGNVLGSSGSVVPIFRKQIAAGGPVTVTHPDMKRYFMTISEASQLVLQAGAIAQGGEVFVLDMGQPVKILDLARDMIRMAGLTEGQDIDIAFTGVRPGEKLYEELALTDEQTRPTSHPKIRVWQLTPIPAQELEQMLHRLSRVINASSQKIVEVLQQCVSEYRPAASASQSSVTTMPVMPAPAAAAAPATITDQASALRLLVAQAHRAA